MQINTSDIHYVQSLKVPKMSDQRRLRKPAFRKSRNKLRIIVASYPFVLWKLKDQNSENCPRKLPVSQAHERKQRLVSILLQ